jgi:hypothetical protein
MSADIINLNKVRKARAKAEQTKTAAENRVKHGRTKVERKKVEADETLAARRLDGTKRDEPQ